MKLSIQRQCDGAYDEPAAKRCDTRLEVDTVVGDRIDPAAFQLAWVQIATTMGWRRFGAAGEASMARVGQPPTLIVVPAVRTWVMCPECAARGNFVCAHCGENPCMCAMGPFFDVRKA